MLVPMFDQLASSASHGITAHRVVGIGVVALATLAAPSFGIPIALAAASYGIVKFSSPHKVLRGHHLSPAQQHRAGLILGATVLAVGTVYSATDFSLQLAHQLEYNLHQAISAAYAHGDIKPGEIFTACRGIICARATIIQPATPRTLGIARLGGFAVHDDTVFGWRRPMEQAEASATH
jgi:hypothetical protein